MKKVDQAIVQRVEDYKEKMTTEINLLIKRQGLNRYFFNKCGIGEPQLNGVINNNRAYTFNTILVMLDILGEDFSEFFSRIK